MRRPRQWLFFALVFLPAVPAQAQVILHSFAGGPSDGRGPSGSLIQSGGLLYGMTPGGGTAVDGTVFRIGINGTGFSLLHSFIDGPADGRNPVGSLLQIGPTLYGTTEFGGNAGN